MSAGPLDRRIQLQAPEVTRDPDTGAELVQYLTRARCWAQVLEEGAGESSSAEQRVMTRQLTLRIRWRSQGVPSTWQVLLDDTRRLVIRGVVEVGRRQWLHLNCEETSDA